MKRKPKDKGVARLERLGIALYGTPQISIGKAAALLGVQRATVIWMEGMGKIKSRRDPISGWRIFKLEDVLKLKAERENKSPEASSGLIDKED